MNWGKVVFGMIVLAGLAGCQQNAAPSSHAASVTSSHQTEVATKKLPWSTAKAKNLEALMGEFGVKMSQNYTAVTTKTSTSWNDIDLSAYIQADKRIRLGKRETKANWLPKTKAQSNAANIVAVYADDADKILYLFEVQSDGQARVWVSQTGLQAGLLALKQTGNSELTHGFVNIVAGKRATVTAGSPASTQSTSETSSSRQDDQSQAPSAQTAHAVVFDSRYRHTWYGYNDYDQQLHTIVFTANSISNDGGTAAPVYQGSERTAADKAFLNHPGDQKADETKMNWGAARSFTYQGQNWINVRGWYQSAGDGSYYRVVTRTVDGQAQPVLEVASGAEIWLDANYYLTSQLADAHRTETYSDEHLREDD